MTTLLEHLPHGARLTPEALASRHRILTRLLWLHVPALLIAGLIGPEPAWETFALPAVPALLALAARLPSTAGTRCDVVAVGLMTCSYALIELSGGDVAAHFHLFVILVFIALYQRWTALLYAILTAVVHHTVLGAFYPERVFGMDPDMRMGALALTEMVAFHVGMVVFEVVGILLLWHFAEEVEDENARLAEEALAHTARAETERRDASEEQARAERERAQRLSALGADLGTRAGAVSAAAARVNEVIGSVDAKAAALSTAVADIAGRAARAASTAAHGRETAGEAADGVRTLEQLMEEISAVNALISQLAGQTNLLSLNATIEAARAGEHGRGFGVVAAEVKALATETAASSGRVSQVIEAVVTQSRGVAASFATTSSVVAEIDEVQNEIAASVEEQSALLREVAADLTTAAGSAEEIERAVRDFSAIAASM